VESFFVLRLCERSGYVSSRILLQPSGNW